MIHQLDARPRIDRAQQYLRVMGTPASCMSLSRSTCERETATHAKSSREARPLDAMNDAQRMLACSRSCQPYHTIFLILLPLQFVCGILWLFVILSRTLLASSSSSTSSAASFSSFFSPSASPPLLQQDMSTTSTSRAGGWSGQRSTREGCCLLESRDSASSWRLTSTTLSFTIAGCPVEYE